jgi:hypothetical protein
MVIRMTWAGAALLMHALAVAGDGVEPVDGSGTLDPVQVEGQRTPLDSRRPEYDRMLPCIACETEANPVDSILMSVLRYVILPSEPPDPRLYTPISARGPRDPLAERQP